MARYKVLKSVAHSFGHSFTSLMNYCDDDYVMGHLLRSAREVREGVLFFDILSGNAAPEALLIPPVQRSLNAYRGWFPELIARHRTDLRYVRAARMTIAFDLQSARPNSHFPMFSESPYVCRVEIEDDRGKVWAAELRDWWFPEAGTPSPETRPRTTGLSDGLKAIRRLGQIIRSRWTQSGGSARVAA